VFAFAGFVIVVIVIVFFTMPESRLKLFSKLLGMPFGAK